MLTMFGTIDESFNGAKVASTIRANKLVIDLREVRRFASWGMAEWMNFLRAAGGIDLYFVECSAYAVQQMNLVSGLLGNGKLVSFFAPVRCNSCSEEFDTLVLLGNDGALGLDADKIQRPCPTCGGTARMAKDRTDLLTTVAKRPAFDIDDDVIGFLRSRFKYEIVPNANRFRAQRRERGGFTYLRLSGNLATLPATTLAESARGATVVDLAGVTYEPSGLDGWRAFIGAALPKATTLQLLDCPVGFIRDGIAPEDLHTKLKVRTFFLRCTCAGCEATSTVLVDVAANLEQLSAGLIPDFHCKMCNAGLRGDVDPALLRQLPARERDVALDEFLAKARAEPATKLEDALVARPTKTKAPSSTARSAFIGSTLAALVVGGVFVGVYLWKREPAAAPVVAERPAAGPGSQSAFHRPDWVLSDAPMSSFCNEQASRLVCVGVSSSNPNRNDAVVEATDAAVEELVNVVGLKISEPWFRTNALPAYTGVRAKALTKLQDAETSDQGPKLAAAADVVRKARHRVVEILQATGGPAVPAQRSDWYWEEYASEKGTGTEFLVFVRYDISLDTVTALVNTYSTITRIGGGAVMTAFPSLAWQFDDFAGGAIVTKAEAELDTLGVKSQQLVIALGDQRVLDAETFATRLASSSGAVKLTIKPPDATAHVVELRR